MRSVFFSEYEESTRVRQSTVVPKHLRSGKRISYGGGKVERCVV